MDTESKKRLAQRMLSDFTNFNKLNWDKSPIEGLKQSEMVVLFCVKKNVADDSPGIKVSEISSLLKVTSPTVTQVISGLEANGLVERNIDRDDRRVIRVRLTEKGQTVIHKAYEDFENTFMGLIEYLGEDDSEKFMELHRKVRKYFSEIKKFEG